MRFGDRAKKDSPGPRPEGSREWIGSLRDCEEVVVKMFAGLSLILLSVGCDANPEDFNWVTHTWKTNLGVYAIDHVSKNHVEVSAAVQRQYLGETCYFENEPHAKVFDGNPWAYLYDDNPRSPRPDRSDWN